MKLLSSILLLPAVSAFNAPTFGLATMRAAAARRQAPPVEDPTLQPTSASASASATSSEVASKLVGGFPASTSLVEAGFTGKNMMTEADREILGDPMFVTESVNYPDSPFSTAEMILITKRFLVKNQGIDQPDLLSEDFKFMGPVVGGSEGLSKSTFLEAVGGFDIKKAFPDLDPGFHHFRVDPFAPDRVFFTSKATGTHLGPFLGNAPTGKSFETPPQACSVTIDADGKVKKYTIGHVMDRSVGNTGGLGGIFGPAYAIGKPLPFPEARPYKMSKRYMFFNKLGQFLSYLKKRKEAAGASA